MSLCLLLDTSLTGIAVGLADLDLGSEGLKWHAISTNRYSSINFVEKQVLSGLEHAENRLEDLTHIVVSNGPGSFTGLRVGLAWCYGIMKMREKDLQILGCSSLECFAQDRVLAPHGPSSALVAMPSTRTTGYFAQAEGENVYSQAFALESLRELPIGSNPVLVLTEWPELFSKLGNEGFSYELLSAEACLEQSLRVLLNKALKSQDHFSSELPIPNYQKKSTVELQQGH